MRAGYSIKAKGNAEAEIYLYGDVGGWLDGVSPKQFAEDLKALGSIRKIVVRINSGGGDVFDGLTIYRQLVDHAAKVVVHVDGLAASIASVIAMAGDEIYISEAAFMMIHEAWGLTIGNAADMRLYADRLEATTGSLADVYTARTGRKRAQVIDWMKAETWFTAAEAVGNGFATAVEENLRIAARLDPARHKYRNIPVALTAPAAIERPLHDSVADAVARMKLRVDMHRLNRARAA